jgi:hypothetical protein
VTVIFQYQQDLPVNKGYVMATMTPITPMSRKYKKEDAMLRPEHQSTLEKNQADRIARRKLIANKLKDLDKEVK